MGWVGQFTFSQEDQGIIIEIVKKLINPSAEIKKLILSLEGIIASHLYRQNEHINQMSRMEILSLLSKINGKANELRRMLKRNNVLEYLADGYYTINPAYAYDFINKEKEIQNVIHELEKASKWSFNYLSPNKRGRNISGLNHLLIFQIAHCFEYYTGEKATPSRNTRFHKLLSLVFKAVKVPCDDRYVIVKEVLSHRKKTVRKLN